MITLKIKNPINKDLKVLLGGQKFTFKANSLSVSMTAEKANHFANHLSRMIAREQGISIKDFKKIAEIRNEILVEDKVIDVASEEGSFESLEVEATELKLETEPEGEVDTSEVVPTPVVKEKKAKPSFE